MHRKYPLAEYSRRGERIFREKVEPNLVSATPSRFVAIDIESEDYVVHPDHREAVSRLKARHAQAQVWVRRTDSPAALFFGRTQPA